MIPLAVVACGSNRGNPPSTTVSTTEKAAIDGDNCTGSNTVAAFGDSLTYALTKNGETWGQASPTWLQTMAADLGGWCTLNGGEPSQGSAEIAVRQGGLRPQITLNGNHIPSSADAVTITAVSPPDGWSLYSKAGTIQLHGTLAGVAGNLQHVVTLGTHTWSFLPDAAPSSPVSVPAGTEFIGDKALGDHDALQIIWAGTNNWAQPYAIKRDVAAMVDSLPHSARYLIIGTIPQVNNDLADTYGPRFVDLYLWLSANGMAAAGITSPTADDLSAVAAGSIPPSLTVDGAHFIQAAYNAIGHHLATVVAALGWD
jgi:lysophospholipase L1-like esterase